VPSDTDNIVVNTNVALTQNVTLKYLKCRLFVTKNGSLCGDYTIDCNFIFMGPVSCKSIIFEGGCGGESTIILTGQMTPGTPTSEGEFTGCFNPGTGVPAKCGLYTVPQAGFINSNACVGQPVAFTDTSFGSFICEQWFFPGGSPSWSNLINPEVVYNSPGSYQVTLVATNPKGADTIIKTIYINPLPTACCNSSITIGNSVQLNTTNSVSCTWSPPSGLSCTNCCNPTASPITNTTYTVSMISDSGCRATEPITVDVNCYIFIPDAFSPNGDGQNDILYVHGDCIKTMQFEVFDRWGNKVFETNDRKSGWDGKFMGQPLNTGSYIYVFSATLYDGTTQTRKGNVALIR